MRKIVLLAALALSGCSGCTWTDEELARPIGDKAVAIDGDTFDSNGLRYRLARIDAAEMPGHCRPGRQCVDGDPFAAKRALQGLLDSGYIYCAPKGKDHYKRILVECFINDEQNISDIMIATGQAEGYRW